MKKLFIGGLLALVLVAPVSSSALTQEETNAQLLQIINSLMAQVQVLLAKLVAMEAQQVQDSQTLQTVVTQTAPVQTQVLGAVQVATPVFSLGTAFCDPDSNRKGVVLPFTISGDAWKYGVVKVSASEPLVPFPSNVGPVFESKNLFQNNGATYNVKFPNNAGNTSVTIEIGRKPKGDGDNSPITEYTFPNTVLVGDVCQ